MSVAEHLRIERLDADSEASLVVTLDKPEGWDFEHGQYVVLEREIGGERVARCYSLCTVAPDGPLRVAVRRVPDGAFSGWLHEQAQPGDELLVRPPKGRFTHALDASARKTYLLVAAGSGITPVYGVAATVLEREPQSRVTLVVVNRSLERAMLLEPVEGLKNRFLDRLQIWHVLTREQSSLDLLEGRPDRDRLAEMVESELLPRRPDEVFVCAPSGLAAEVRAFADTLGVPAANVRSESFGARRTKEARGSVSSEGREVVVWLHGSSASVRAEADETVLEVAERARPGVPSSCRAGVCSTCMARLLEGEVSHGADHVLSEAERKTGLILACQARPASPRVVVTFDV